LYNKSCVIDRLTFKPTNAKVDDDDVDADDDNDDDDGDDDDDDDDEIVAGGD